jgi:hypothetical protein
VVYQRDYILRIIEQLGRALVQLRKRILAEDLSLADLRGELAAVAQQAGLNLALVRSVDRETLQLLIAPTGEVEPARCWLAAELLYLEALRAREEGRTAAVTRELQRALELYAMLPDGWSAPAELPGAGERRQQIRRWLEEADHDAHPGR